MSLTNIFVYGTLKTGQPNHYFISQAAEDGHEATLIGHAKTVQRYPLVVAGCVNCPYLLDAPGKGKNVEGEVYRVDATVLKILDELEGHPDYYQRDKIDVKFLDLDNSNGLESLAYFLRDYNKDLEDLPMFEKFDTHGHHGKYIPPKDREEGTAKKQKEYVKPRQNSQ